MPEIGSRIAYVLGDNARLGVVTDYSSHTAIIKLDNGNSLPVKPERLRTVNFWKNSNREREIAKLKFYQPELTALQIFKNKQGIIFGVAAMRAMWYWTNFNIFDNKLREPQFIAAATKSKYGRYKLARGKKIGTIIASSTNHDITELFATILHETIHQYNFEVDWLQLKQFNPNNEGTHGHAFTKWIPTIIEKTGIRITIKGGSEDAITFDETEEPKTKRFIFVIVKPRDKWGAFIVNNEKELDRIDGELGSLLRRINAEDTRVYAGYSDIARIKKSLPVAPRGDINLNKLFKFVQPVALLKFAVQDAEPVDGWDLPTITDN